MISFSRHTLFRRFIRDLRGNFMILFGLGVAVIFLAAGLAVDYSLALANKTRMSNALDAATLAAARGIAAGELSANSGTKVENYLKSVFAANLQVNDLSSSVYSVDSVSIDSTAGTVSATASMSRALHLIKVGSSHDTMQIESNSAVKYAVGNIEVAMVLDLTSSMGGAKLSALKDSAKLGVEMLLAINSATVERARVSLVPYAIGVNVGNHLVDYVYADYFGTNSNAPAYDPSLYDAATHPVYYDWVSFQSSNRACTDSPAADFGGAYYDTGYSDNCWAYVTEPDGSNSDNCASERKAPATSGGTSYQYTDANPFYGMISRDARLAKDWCPAAPIVTLTSNKNTLDSAIDGFSALGWTAGHIGLQWGWYTVSHDWANYLPTGSEPGDHTDPAAELDKFIIMMTDGVFNTAYAGVPSTDFQMGYQSTASYSHFAALCSAIKADDITLFTIGFLLNNDGAKGALDSCATDDAGDTVYYYDVTTASELEDAFASIAQTILTLRLTK